MPRGAKLSATIDSNRGGFTAGYAKASELKKAGVSSWTFYYHKPYTFDWAEAKVKAKERVGK